MFLCASGPKLDLLQPLYVERYNRIRNNKNEDRGREKSLAGVYDVVIYSYTQTVSYMELASERLFLGNIK